MKIFFTIITTALSLVFLQSCEDVINDIDLGETPDLLTVDGMFTDSLKIHTFNLTRTRSYFSESDFPKVEGAQVRITNLTTGEDVDVLQELSPGVYSTSTELKGQPGNVYRLEIIDDGEVYHAIDSMPSVSEIDSLMVKENTFFEDWNALYLNAKEPQDEVNFYMWHISFNDSLLDNYKDVPMSDDIQLRENIQEAMIYDDNLEIEPERNFITEIDTAVRIKVQQYGISKPAYDFIFSLSMVLNKGNIFDTPMAEVTTNVWKLDNDGKPSEKQTGYFMACAVDEKEIVYDPKKEE